MVTDSCERICFICFEKAPSNKKNDVVFHLQIQIFNPPPKKKEKHKIRHSSSRNDLQNGAPPESVSQRFPPKGEVLQVYDECRCRSCWGRVLSEAYTFFPFVENVGKCHPGWLVCLVGDWLGLCRFCMLSFCRCLCPCSCVLVSVIVFLLTCLVASVLFFSGHLFLLKSRQIVFFRMVRTAKGTCLARCWIHLVPGQQQGT